MMVKIKFHKIKYVPYEGHPGNYSIERLSDDTVIETEILEEIPVMNGYPRIKIQCPICLKEVILNSQIFDNIPSITPKKHIPYSCTNLIGLWEWTSDCAIETIGFIRPVNEEWIN